MSSLCPLCQFLGFMAGLIMAEDGDQSPDQEGGGKDSAQQAPAQ
jgi:hypothetical protein